jgi:hypothetical protein
MRACVRVAIGTALPSATQLRTGYGNPRAKRLPSSACCVPSDARGDIHRHWSRISARSAGRTRLSPEVEARLVTRFDCNDFMPLLIPLLPETGPLRVWGDAWPKRRWETETGSLLDVRKPASVADLLCKYPARAAAQKLDVSEQSKISFAVAHSRSFATWCPRCACALLDIS